MRKLTAVAALLALGGWSSTARANLGGYRHGIALTGDAAPFQSAGTEQVRILDELLDIRLGRLSATVTVRYQMRNEARQPVQVRFGFPVEVALGSEWQGAPQEGAEGFQEYRRNCMEETPQQLVGYTVTVGGAPVSAAYLVEPFSTGKVRPFPGSGALEKVAGWMVSEASFPPAAPVEVEVRYTVPYLEERHSVSDDVHAAPLSFVYRLSTGAVWKGPIARGTVRLRADGIAADEVDIVSPRSRFKRAGDTWTWTFTDLEPTLADDLTVRAIPGYDELFDYRQADGYTTAIERLGKWGRSHQRFRATSSSVLAPAAGFTYGPEHLIGGPVSGSWCEGVPGPGVGQWVEVAPERPAPLLGLSVVPGVASRERPELFKANGRPSRVEITLNDEHRFMASLGDSPESQFVPIVGYARPVRKLRVTMAEVLPGAKYDDTCISRIVLYDRATQKPPVHGAR